MKLVIQIPCFNEETSLPRTIADLPREISGIATIEVVIIDDGSSDETSKVARSLGLEHIVRHNRNRGLGRAFRTGLDYSLALGADVVVNTDGDGQYVGADVAKLIAPILMGEADVVIGGRDIMGHGEFGIAKKFFHILGSGIVRYLAGVSVPDAVSGFRAMSRDAALNLNILSTFSYTTEMLIQASHKGLRIVSVPIATNARTRDSRLFKSTPEFIARQSVTIVRMYAMYRPVRFFALLGTFFCLLGIAPIARFTYLFLLGEGSGNIQSLILGAALLTMGFITFVAGLLSDLISHNRQLAEATLNKVRKLELGDTQYDLTADRLKKDR